MLVETQRLKSSDASCEQQGLAHGFSPWAVIRLAGASARSLPRMVFGRTLSLLDLLLEKQQEIATGNQDLVALLERTIGRMSPGPCRIELVRLKRDIFNNRLPGVPLSETAMHELHDRMDPREVSLLKLWLANGAEIGRLSKLIEQVFVNELREKEGCLRAVCRKKEFRCGLEYASPALSQSVAKYLANPQSITGAKRARIHRSIVRYYARSAVKLSPFGTFTRSRVVRVVQDYGSLGSERCIGVVKSVVLNRAFIAQLAHSISLHPELRHFVPIFCNRSLTSAGNHLLFIGHEYGGEGGKRFRVPHESLVQLPVHPIVNRVLEVLEKSGKFTFRDALAEAIASEIGGPERANSFIEQLISIGVLKCRVPLPEDNSPAIHSLLSFVEEAACRDTRFACLMVELKQLAQLEDCLQRISSEAVGDVLVQMQSIGARAHTTIGDYSATDWAGNLVYENSVEQQIGHIAVPPQWSPAVQDLRQFLCAFVPLIDLNYSPRESMRYVLNTEFRGGPVPFLCFAAKYQKMLKAVKGAAVDPDHDRNPFGLESLRNLGDIWNEIMNVFHKGREGRDFDLKSAGEIERWTERFNALNLARPMKGRFPVTCYVQPCLLEHDRAGLVVNSISTGSWGALLRACSGLRDQNVQSEVVGELSREIRKIWNAVQPSEMRATFDFNANLCPPVTRHSINYMSDPTAGENAIPLGALWISLSEQGDLRITSGGQDIVPINFGSMSRRLYPPVARLLLALGEVEPLPYMRLSGRRANAITCADEKLVQHVPRFTFGSCVISRQRWYFPPERLPKQAKVEDALQCFTTIRKWQRAWVLPDQLFVHCGAARSNSDDVAKKTDARSFVSRKPQYIDFRSYFMAEAFADGIERKDGWALCEEALPSPAQWAHMGMGRPFEIAADICVGRVAACSDQTYVAPLF